jgi:hypothetical protein
VVVYKPELAPKMMKSSLASHRKYQLPCALLRFDGELSEDDARRLSRSMRLYDDLFMLREGTFVALLSMIMPQHVPLVTQRLQRNLPHLTITAVTKAAELHG